MATSAKQQDWLPKTNVHLWLECVKKSWNLCHPALKWDFNCSISMLSSKIFLFRKRCCSQKITVKIDTEIISKFHKTKVKNSGGPLDNQAWYTARKTSTLWVLYSHNCTLAVIVNKLHRKKVVGRWSADHLPTTYRPPKILLCRANHHHFG